MSSTAASTSGCIATPRYCLISSELSLDSSPSRLIYCPKCEPDAVTYPAPSSSVGGTIESSLFLVPVGCPARRISNPNNFSPRLSAIFLSSKLELGGEFPLHLIIYIHFKKLYLIPSIGFGIQQ